MSPPRIKADLFPQSRESEAALLGGCILDPQQIETIDLDADDFYRRDHGHLWTLLRRMRAEGDDVNLVSVVERVGRNAGQGGDEMYGGLAYVLGLVEAVPSTANLGHYARIVREHAVRRRLIGELDARREALMAAQDDPGLVASELVTAIDRLTASDGQAEWAGLGEYAAQVYDDAAAARDGDRPRSQGPEIPWMALGEYVPYLPRGEIVVVAARPAMGKTAFAMSIAQAVADYPDSGAIGVISLEVSGVQIARGVMLRDARTELGLPIGDQSVTTRAIERGSLSAAAWDALASSAARTDGRRIYVSRREAATGAEVEASIVKLHRWLALRGQRLDKVVLDYLQLLSFQGDNRAQAIGDVTTRLKRLAKRLDITLVLLSQLNRDCEKRQDKRPMMADLRDSGAIEQDAAVILGLYRDWVYNEHTADPTAAEVLVLKNRYGRTGIAEMVFDGAGLRWADKSGGNGPLRDL